MTLRRPEDLTLAPARISAARFRDVLAVHASPVRADADSIWAILTGNGVDPSFALGQFLVESIYGTRGHAVTTKSWGNMLWDSRWTSTRQKYSPGNGYTYARYPNWAESVVDYCSYIRRYAVTADARYGGITDTIDKATARWVGDPLLSEEHERYLRVLLAAINDEYEFVPGTFTEVGDAMISVADSAVTSTRRYPVPNGTELCRGTNGDVYKLASFSTPVGLCRFLGPVGQPWSDPVWAWGAVIVGVARAGGPTVFYIRNPDKAKVTTA